MVFGDDLRLARVGSVARDFNGQFTKVTLEGVLAAPVAVVARFAGNHLVHVVDKVVGHFGLQCPFNQGLGGFLWVAILAAN